MHDKSLNLVLYGDSISAGSNASGKTIAAPFLPIWGELLAENLRRNYKANVNIFNPSVGGMNSDWGIGNADELINPHKPDLVIIAFGMNDGVHGDEFAAKIQKMMDIVKDKNPSVEFILVATSLPNSLLSLDICKFYRFQYEYKEALQKICGEGAALANIRDMQNELLKHKRFIDMTGNNVNHPNDFFVRCHAQYLSGMLIK
jgi:lysophospholipase L1-like esterase